MPRGNGIKKSLLWFAWICMGAFCHAQSHPLVIGYERFHSDEPSLEGGRILFNELGCVNCHDRKSGLPDRKGPELNGILERSHPDWIRSFLKNPSKLNLGTNMPNLNLSDRDVEAVVHYLASMPPEKPLGKAFKFVNAERGMTLYHDLGCASCHEPSPDYYPAEGKPDPNSFTYPHVPLPNLREKYDIDSLSTFLYYTHLFSPQGRMPQFKLDREDGGDIAAHLLDFQNGDATFYPSIPKLQSNQSLVDLGRNIVERNNCVACHNISSAKELTAKQVPISPDIRLAELKNHPDYSLSRGQSLSIELFLNQESTEAPVISQLQTLNCLACHERDGAGGPDASRGVYFTGDHDQGDTGRYPPPLTDVGRKLQSDWLAAAIKGEKKVRPYLRTQMPVFGSSAQGLAENLTMNDDKNNQSTFPSGNLDMGRHLLGTQGGLNCITCHNWGDRRSLGIQGIDLSTMAQRLNPDWLIDYLINPAAYRPNTLMPSFWPKAIASNQSILEGNTQAQIAAIYAFSETGKGLPGGFPDEDST